jgi:LysM repeat protein
MRKLSGIFLTGLLFPLCSLASVDSIGTEVFEGKTYILHRVEKSEGLYGIARRYRSTVSAIQQANTLESTSLKLGEVLKVPVEGKAASSAAAAPISEEKSPAKAKSAPASKPATTKITHTVRKGETLFAIARKYDVSVQDIKTWNNLKSTNLSLGQRLQINKQGAAPVTAGNTNASEEPREIPAGGKINPVASGGVKASKYLPSNEISETGMAGWLEDKNVNPKRSIALHKTAPVGTIIRVTNKQNNKSVYVKVIGVLPETGDNENTIIVISKAVAAMLDVRDPKFQATLTYSLPKE